MSVFERTKNCPHFLKLHMKSTGDEAGKSLLILSFFLYSLTIYVMVN